ncbi:MAG: hypothetical protein AAGK97_15945 [Bacteroidota bacterium]
MKNTNQCPKCNSRQIVKIPAPRGHIGSNDIRKNMFSYIKPTRYMCGQCGYSEEWIDDYVDVDKIVKKYGVRDIGNEYV